LEDLMKKDMKTRLTPTPNNVREQIRRAMIERVARHTPLNL